MHALIQKASPTDAEELSALTMRSKAYWGYEVEQLLVWRDDLSISEKYIENNAVFILKENHCIVGYYGFSYDSVSMLKLDNIFVDPTSIGRGYGKILIEDFLTRVKELPVTTITLDADPNSEWFYQKYGFRTVGQLSSSIPNRFLPIMELQLL